MPKPYKIH
jgi:factor associated with neutral sphingomyelinase activation